jgi:hypothetical protein
MSDFLDHIVSRSLAPKASVQPRLPSLFEPLPAGELYGVESSGGFSEANSESGQPAAASAEASPLPPNIAERLRNLEEIMRAVQRDAGGRGPHSAWTDPGSPIRKIVKLPGEKSPPQPPVFIAKPSREELSTVVPKKNERSAIHSVDHIVFSGLPSQQADVSRLSGRPTTAHTSATSAPCVGRLNVEPNMVSATAVNRRTEARQKSDESEAVPLPSSTTQRASSTATKDSGRNSRPIQPLVPSVAKAPLLSSEIIASTRGNGFRPPPPTIHVTIGRVEVRAMPRPSDRRQAAPPKGPKLSLEDYLRSRGEGNK